MTMTPRISYDHIGVVHLGGDLGATRYVDCPTDWTVGDRVGLLVSAPQHVVVVPSTDTTDEVQADVAEATEAEAADMATRLQDRYEAAVHVLATLMHLPDDTVGAIVDVRPHQATLLLGQEVSDRVAEVLRDVDTYIADHKWDTYIADHEGPD
jgi:hypothetical protein